MGLPKCAKARIGKGRMTDNVTFSLNGAQLAVASNIGIWFYDSGTGAEVVLLTGHAERVSSIAFSPDGLTLASGSWRIRLWDARI
jgi:WD40 repeat protein